MAANSLKMEVKNEPGMDDLEMADIDEVGGYEDDTGELIFPKTLSQGWLVRVPKDLWTLLSHIDDDQEIQLGEIRIWQNKDVRGKDTETIRLNLAPQIPKKDLSLIPKQYDLTSQVTAPKNTFVFSEKNLPGFRPRRNQDALRSVNANSSPAAKIEKPYQRGPRTIPKRTEYLGAAQRELVCTPRDNAEYRRIESLRRSQKTAAQTAFIHDETAAKNLHNQGMQIGFGDENYIHTGSIKKRSGGAQENKATRMPEAALVDALQKAFSRYKFWPMSALKKEFMQPEAWLKEVLGKIAVLVRTGPAANYYMLRVENQGVGDDFFGDGEEGGMIKSEELAPEVKGEDGVEEEDEDVDFEDV
jgi:transcription initiation factor TFIIF subunit beta